MIKAIETVYNGYRFRSRLEARWAVFFDTLGIKYEYEPEGFDLGDGIWYLPDFYLPTFQTWVEVKPTFPTEEELTKVLLFNFRLLSEENLNNKQIVTRCIFLCGTPGLTNLSFSLDGWTLRDGYIAFAPLAFLNNQSGIEIAYPKNIINENCNENYVVVGRVSAFAMVDGGTVLDIWPIYICEISEQEKQDYLTQTGLKKKTQTKKHRDWLKKVQVLLVAKYPQGYSKNIYVGKGVKYDTENLLKAYAAARQARFEHGENGS